MSIRLAILGSIESGVILRINPKRPSTPFRWFSVLDNSPSYRRVHRVRHHLTRGGYLGFFEQRLQFSLARSETAAIPNQKMGTCTSAHGNPHSKAAIVGDLTLSAKIVVLFGKCLSRANPRCCAPFQKNK